MRRSAGAALVFLLLGSALAAGQNGVDAVEAVLRNRLPADPQDSRVGGESFSSRVEIVTLVERTLKQPLDREEQARMTWYLLRAARYALAVIPYRQSQEPPYGQWLAAHNSIAQPFEIAGHWIVSYDFVQRAHDQFRDTVAADDIGWFLVTNGLAGECEGDTPCTVTWVNRLAGEYLRWHPTGRHNDEAADWVAKSLNGHMDNLLNYPKVLAEFIPLRHCNELQKSLAPLRTSVAASSASLKPIALAAIGRFTALCAAPGTK